MAPWTSENLYVGVLVLSPKHSLEKHSFSDSLQILYTWMSMRVEKPSLKKTRSCMKPLVPTGTERDT